MLSGRLGRRGRRTATMAGASAAAASGVAAAAETAPAGLGVTAGAALWTFPSILASAFVIAWAAEVAQFFMSQGLALAILAWLQILPEFAVEAVIAWDQNVVNMTANFTGSIRLLVGLGWPMIFVTAAVSQRRKTGRWLWEIELEPEHAVEVIGLLLPILYFFVIWWKASLGVSDGVLLTALYLVYLYVVNRMPPKDHEEAGELDYVPRKVMGLRPGLRGTAIVSMFVLGGVMLFTVTHPFVESLKSLALAAGISEYVFIQWVAPFLSEFPEFLSAFRWAKTVRHAPMGLMNVVSSNINQWTVLAGMIPVVYSLSLGRLAVVPFDGMHRHEILITVLQSLLGMLLLVNMRFAWWEAVVLFALWFVQFVIPDLRVAVMYAYGATILLGLVQVFTGHRSFEAFRCFAEHWKTRVAPAKAS
jgi:cation:H+ antiporter